MCKNVYKILACVAMMYGVFSMAMAPISRAQMIAFFMSGQPRLGEDSPAGIIDDYVRRDILNYLLEPRNVTVVNYDEAKLVAHITDDQTVVRNYYPATGLDLRFELSALPIMLALKKARQISSTSIPSRLSVTLPLSYIRVNVMDSEGLHSWYSFTLTPRQVLSIATLQITQRCAKHISFDGDSCVVGIQR